MTSCVCCSSHQIRELLDFYKYDGDSIPIIRGSALAAVNGENHEIGRDAIVELMNAVDETIPIPERALDKEFLMPVEDVFSIAGRGTVATGRIESGVISVGDEVELKGLDGPVPKTTATGVEMFKKMMDRGEAGDNVGILLRGLKRDDIRRGQVLAAPGTCQTHTKFEAEVYVSTKEEGGRHTPFVVNYRPQFFFRTADVTGAITELKDGAEMIMPGDNTTLTCELITPVAMHEGLRFAVREGGRTVAAGVVSKVLE